MAKQAAAPDNSYLEQLKAAAEAQMRRPAPELDDAGPQHKKQKVADNCQQEPSEHVEGPVGRYAYAALDSLMQGCTAFLGSCGFRRERSSTKEVLDILHKVLPEGTIFELVKVGCNGLVVITAKEAEGNQQIDPTATVQEILQRIQSANLQRTKFCQRIMPAQTTCALTATALKEALTKIVTTHIKQQYACSSNSKGDQQQQQHQAIEFAVAYKNRDNVTVPCKQENSNEATQQQQSSHQQQAQQPQQQPQRQQQQALSGALQPVPASELVDRSRAIDIAAAVMQECCSSIGGARVNLVNPQVVLLLEVVPLARHQLACAVAAVPASMMVTKPKLAVKPTGVGGR